MTTPDSSAPRHMFYFVQGAVCEAHGLALLVTHVNDGQPCSDFLADGAPAPAAPREEPRAIATARWGPHRVSVLALDDTLNWATVLVEGYKASSTVRWSDLTNIEPTSPAAPREEPRAETESGPEPRLSIEDENALQFLLRIERPQRTLALRFAEHIVRLRSALDAKDAELRDERSIAKESIRVLRENLEAAQSALDAKDEELDGAVSGARFEIKRLRLHAESLQSALDEATGEIERASELLTAALPDTTHERLSDHVADVCAALDEAKRDTERLKWLGEHLSGDEVAQNSDGRWSVNYSVDGIWQESFGSTFSEAIDAARSAVSRDTPGHTSSREDYALHDEVEANAAARAVSRGEAEPRISDIVREANENARRASVREANQQATDWCRCGRPFGNPSHGHCTPTYCPWTETPAVSRGEADNNAPYDPEVRAAKFRKPSEPS